MKQIFSKQNRALLAELVRTDFKLRYQGSVLGYAWSLLRPFLLFLILYVVFVRVLSIGTDIPHYPAYLLLGIVLWNFFSEMTNMSLGSIVGRGDLIRKIKIPRWIIILSSSVSATINLGLSLIVVGVFMYLNGVDPMSLAWLFPLLLAELYIFALGLSLVLSAAFVKYRDINYIWEVIMQALFYLTPILYPLHIVGNVTYEKILLLSPIAQVIQDGRYLLITQNKVLTTTQVYGSGWWRLAPLAVVGLVLVAGLLYFKKQSKYFAENI